MLFTDDDININVDVVKRIWLTLLKIRSCEVTFNEEGDDIDFRIETVNDSGVLHKINISDDTIQLGSSIIEDISKW